MNSQKRSPYNSYMKTLPRLLLFAAATTSPTFAWQGGVRFSLPPRVTAALRSTTPDVEAKPIALPITKEQMIAAAAESVKRAQAEGVSNQRLRVLLPSPRIPGLLIAPDETWEGGIMQLYQACSPLTRDLVRALSFSAGGVAPRLKEQRLDRSGVDGEGLWTSECVSASDDVSALVQPSSEQLKNIEAVCQSASGRLVLMINPQYRDSDDTMDFLAGKGGLFGSMANFLGGKAKFVGALDELGFQTTFALEAYVIRGSELKYLKTWGSDWKIYITDDEGQPLFLGESTTRPDYNRIDDLLEKNLVAQKALRDLGTAPKLAQDSIKLLYGDME
jgi:hypothetical protein